MARKKKSEAENEADPPKKAATRKKRDAVASSEPENAAESVKKPAPRKKREPAKQTEPKESAAPRKKSEPAVTPEPAAISEPIAPEKPGEPTLPIEPPEQPIEPVRTFRVHDLAPHAPEHEVSQNTMAAAGLCTFLGAMLFSFGRAEKFSVAVLGAVVGLAGYLQVMLIAKRANLRGLLREHYFAWFALIIVIISSIIFGVELADMAGSRSRPDETLSGAAPTPTPAEDRSTQVLPDGRILLVDVTPEKLSELPRRYSSTEVEKMMKPYWKKWIRLSGVVKDINSDKPESSILLIEGKDAPSSVQITYFSDATQIERLRKLKKRDPVKAMCQITRRYTAGDYSFEKCELVD